MEFPWLLWFAGVSSAFLQRGKGCRSGNYIESTTLQGNFLPFFVFANFYFDHIWLSANIIQQWPRLVSDKGKYVRVGIMLPQSAVSNVRASQCEAGQSVFAHLRFTTRHCSSWQPGWPNNDLVSSSTFWTVCWTCSRAVFIAMAGWRNLFTLLILSLFAFVEGLAEEVVFHTDCQTWKFCQKNISGVRGGGRGGWGAWGEFHFNEGV